jgi:type II secretion system protein G
VGSEINEIKQHARRRPGHRRDMSAVFLFAIVGGMLAISIVLALWLYFADVGSPRVGAATPETLTPDDTLTSRDAEHAVVRAQRGVAGDGIISLDIERFRLGMGRYPNSIEELTDRPGHLADHQRWDGPYVNNPHLLIDPWGNRYEYESPGVHNRESFDLWSSGPDGVSGNQDDIGNW